jgi:hypothetical protein
MVKPLQVGDLEELSNPRATDGSPSAEDEEKLMRSSSDAT